MKYNKGSLESALLAAGEMHAKTMHQHYVIAFSGGFTVTKNKPVFHQDFYQIGTAVTVFNYDCTKGDYIPSGIRELPK